MVNIIEKDSFVEANKKGYKDSDEGILSTIKGIADANWQYTKHHPYKVAAVTIGVLSLVALTSAYFMIPAYAAFVSKTAASAIAVVSNGAKALYAFAATNPVFAIFLAVAAVAAVVIIGVLAYKCNDQGKQIDDQANKIDEVNKILKDTKVPEPESKLDAIAKLFQPAPAQASTPS